MMRGAGAGLLAILCGGGATAQSAFPVEKVPAGCVTDTEGKPVHGARVWIRVENVGAQYPRARNQILRKQRLPVVFTARDGSFVLPFTRAQRLLSTPIDGHFSLVVEKAGFGTWIEPLGGGLFGYLGSQVKLRRLGPEDQFEVRVKQPVPGMKLLVYRRASRSLGNQPHVNLTRVLDVPTDGIVKVAMPLVPSPRAIMGNYNYLPLSREVQLLYPGRSSAAIPVRYGQRVVEIPAVNTSAGRPTRVVANDRKPLRELRGLFYCPDQKHRWFSLPEAELPHTSTLALYAVTAKDCVVQNPVRTNRGYLVLKRAPTPGPRKLRVVNQRGKPIRGAMVGCYAMDSVRDLTNPWNGPGTAWRVRRTDSDGEVQVPDVVDHVATVLVVQAPGYRQCRVTEPRSIVGTHEVRLQAGRYGSVELTLQTGDGAPLMGAYLRFPDRCYQFGAILDRIPRTDENGTIRLDHLPQGTFSALIIGEGVICRNVKIDIKPRNILRLQESVESAPILCGLTVDDDNKPVPFAPIQPYVSHRLRNVRLPGQMVSDSQGRFVLRGVPEQALNVQVRAMQQQFRWMNHPMDRDGGVTKIPTTRASLLLVRMPQANPVRRAVTYVMNQRRQVVSLPSNQTTVATLIRWTREDNVSLFFQLSEGPPLRIDNDVIAKVAPKALDDGPAPEVAVLGERAICRRVPVQLEGAGGIEGDRLRLEISNIGGSRPYVYEDLGLGVTRDKNGRWWFLARDDGAYRGRILHPQLRPTEFEVPAKGTDGADKPITLSLQMAVPLTFQIHLGKQRLNKNNNLNVRLRDQMRRNYVLYWHQPLSSIKYTLDAQNVMRLRCPVALDPGKFNVHLRVYGTRISVNTNVTVTKGQAGVVIQLKDGKAKVLSPKSEATEPVGSAPDKR